MLVRTLPTISLPLVLFLSMIEAFVYRVTYAA
jgi:hypothetical protein